MNEISRFAKRQPHSVLAHRPRRRFTCYQIRPNKPPQMHHRPTFARLTHIGPLHALVGGHAHHRPHIGDQRRHSKGQAQNTNTDKRAKYRTLRRVILR